MSQSGEKSLQSAAQTDAGKPLVTSGQGSAKRREERGSARRREERLRGSAEQREEGGTASYSKKSN